MLSDSGSIRIPLEGLGLDHLPDTDELAKVARLEHGLESFLDGQLVFGDQGVGKFPEQNK